MKKRFLLLIGCAMALSFTANAQEQLIDDFEGGDIGWFVVNDAALDWVNNPHPSPVNSSAKVLMITCRVDGNPDAIYNGISGPLLEGLAIPVGTGAGQYRYAHIKVYYDKSQALELSLEAGPGANFGSSWKDVRESPEDNLNKWTDLVIDCQTATAGNYGKIFIMPGRMNHEPWYGEPKTSQIFYLDDVRFSNDPNPYTGPVTSINDANATANTINVSVNDASASISFNLEENADAHVAVYNVAGQLIYQTSLSANAGINTVDATVNNAGTYIVKVTAAGKSMVKKFVK